MKIKNYFALIFAGLMFLLLGIVVYAQTNPLPPGLITAYGPVYHQGCSETDGGINIYQQGINTLMLPNVTGANTTNGTYTISGPDYCQNNNLLVEGVCGAAINSAFNTTGLQNTFYAGVFNCNASNAGNTTYICLNGACLPQTPTNGSGGGNNTNVSLPDLTVLSLNYTYIATGIGNTTNGTIYNYNVTFTSIIRNIGSVVAGNSITRIALFGSTSAPQAFNVPSLAPNQNFVINNTQPFSAISGTQTAGSVADINSSVTESNENNNALVITFTLP